MYNEYRNELLIELSKDFDTDAIKKIIKAVDVVSMNYSFKPSETALVPYDESVKKNIATYLMVKKMEGCSDLTLKNYGYALNTFFDHMSKTVDSITANDIRVYLYAYQSERGCSERSLDKVREYICRYFKWMTSEGYIESDPTINLNKIKHEVKPRKAMSQSELEQIRDACYSAREKAIVEILYSTGCRVSELVTATRNDVDLSAGTIHLFGKGKKHRTSYLNAKAINCIKKYLESRTDDNDALIVSDIAPYKAVKSASIEYTIRKIAERAGLEWVTPHVFRHTTATQAMDSGMPVQEVQQLLGHSSINTTMIYAEVVDKSVHESHNKYVI